MAHPHWKVKHAALDMYIRVFTQHIESYGLCERRVVNIYIASMQATLLYALYELPRDPNWDAIRGGYYPAASMSNSPHSFPTSNGKPMRIRWMV